MLKIIDVVQNSCNLSMKNPFQPVLADQRPEILQYPAQFSNGSTKQAGTHEGWQELKVH